MIPAIDFTNEIHPTFISCGDLTTLACNADDKLNISWKISPYSILINPSSVKCYVFRLVGHVDEKIFPSDPSYLNPNNDPKWESVFTGNGYVETDGSGYHIFKCTDKVGEKFSAQALEEIRIMKRAIYYKVVVELNKMSAGLLPLFIYCNGTEIVARATKNTVFRDRLYNDRETIWTHRNNRSSVYCRVFVDTSEVDKFNNRVTAKPPMVWATSLDGFIDCLDFYTGKVFGSVDRNGKGAVFGGSVDPLNSVFWYADTSKSNKIRIGRCRLVSGSNNRFKIDHTLFGPYNLNTSSWNTSYSERRVPGMTCSVSNNSGNKSVLSVIVDTELVKRFVVSNGGAGIEDDIDEIPRSRFGAIDKIVLGQPNCLGVACGIPQISNTGVLSDSVWTNGHVPLRHISYSGIDVKINSYEVAKFGDSSCWRNFSGFSKDDIRATVLPKATNDYYGGSASSGNAMRNLFNSLNQLIGREERYEKNTEWQKKVLKEMGDELYECFQNGKSKWQKINFGVAYRDYTGDGDYNHIVITNVLKDATKPDDPFWKGNAGRRNINTPGERDTWCCAFGIGVRHGDTKLYDEGKMVHLGKHCSSNIHRYLRARVTELLEEIIKIADVSDKRDKIISLYDLLRNNGYSSKSYEEKDTKTGKTKTIHTEKDLWAVLGYLKQAKDDTTADSGKLNVYLNEAIKFSRSGATVKFNRENDDEIRKLHQAVEKNNLVSVATYIFNKTERCVLQDIGMVYGFGASNDNYGTGPNESTNTDYRNDIRPYFGDTGEDTNNLLPYITNSDLKGITPKSSLLNGAESRADTKYNVFTNPMNSEVRWGWLGLTLMCDGISCTSDIPGLADESNPLSRKTIDKYKKYFKFNDTRLSDRYVPHGHGYGAESSSIHYYKHTDSKNADASGKKMYDYREAPVSDIFPRLSQFGVATSLPTGGWLVYKSSTPPSYLIYQTDSVERRIHKIEFPSMNATPLAAGQTQNTLPINTHDFGDVKATDDGARHVILDDANIVWGISTKHVDRYYPQGVESHKYPNYRFTSLTPDNPNQKYYKNSLATYEVNEITSGFDGMIGKRFGNTPVVEYYLLANGHDQRMISYEDAYDYWVSNITKNFSPKNMFDMTQCAKTFYVGESGNYFNWAKKGVSIRNPDQGGTIVWENMDVSPQNWSSGKTTQRHRYIDNNEFNDDNLGIAPIKARGAIEGIDIGRPTVSLPVGHIKIVVGEEKDKTISCDNPKFGLPNAVPSVFGRLENRSGYLAYDNRPKILSNAGSEIKYHTNDTYVERNMSMSSPYNNWNYHLTAHGYDDLEITERMMFSNVVGWRVKGFSFIPSGNVYGNKKYDLDDMASVAGGEGIWFLKYNSSTNSFVNAPSSDYEKRSDGTYYVKNKDVWMEVIKRVDKDNLWIEPNVRGGLIGPPNATSPNYDPLNDGSNGYKTMRGKINLVIGDVYDLYGINKDQSDGVFAEETNFFYIYERYPYPEFCFTDFNNESLIIPAFWGDCNDEGLE